VVIRVNIQKENIKYVPEFVDSLKQVGIDKRNNIKPYFSLVSNDKGFQAVIDFFGADQNANRIQIVKAGNIENALTLFHAPEDAERRKKIQNRKLLLDLSAESARIEESNRIKKELKNILTGTEYECKSAEIIDFVSAKRHQGKKDLYMGALHQFGRKDGRKIYQLLKRKMSE